MKNLCLLSLCGFLIGTLLAKVDPVYGIDAFKKEFVNKYVKKEPATDSEKALAAAVAKANCNVCHVGKAKKTRNEYGKALDELLDKKTDIKDAAKIQGALEKVAGMKSDPKDPNSPTFGQRIEKGQLPGGEDSTTTASTAK
jgi:hypothetical protein